MSNNSKLMNKPSKKFSPTLFGIVLFSLIVPSARAALIFNDEFVTGPGGYTAGANLLGQNPTVTGFAGPWAGSNTATLRPNSTNLSMAGVTNDGGSLATNTLAAGGSRSDSRSLSAYTGSDTLWFSSLASFDEAALTTGAGQTFTAFLSGPLPTTSSSGSTAATWLSSNGGSLTGFAWGVDNGQFRLKYHTGASSVSTAIPPDLSLTANTTYLLVARVSVNASGNDTLDFWLLDSAPANEAALGTPTYSLSANFLDSNTDITTVNTYLGSTNTDPVQNVSWDAIRMGTSFSDLQIVPEPSIAALLSGAGIALLLRRARRSVPQVGSEIS
jgi:hypothetical protein